MKYEVIDFTENGKCSKCGKCCTNLLPLSDDEIRRIKGYVKKHRIKEQRHNALQGVDMTCPFRDEGKKICTIYTVRPFICREFQCNHAPEDIQQSKLKRLLKYPPILMRNVFFGSKEDADWVKSVVSQMVNDL